MTAWERLVYACALAFWRAFFDMVAQRGVAIEEVSNEADRDATRRFRVLVQRLQGSTPPGSDGGAPAVPRSDGGGVAPAP